MLNHVPLRGDWNATRSTERIAGRTTRGTGVTLGAEVDVGVGTGVTLGADVDVGVDAGASMEGGGIGIVFELGVFSLVDCRAQPQNTRTTIRIPSISFLPTSSFCEVPRPW